MMTGELFLFTWRLETILAEGGRVNRGIYNVNRGEGEIWDIISLRQIHRFHVEVVSGGS